MVPCPFCSITPDRIWIETEHAIAFADSQPVADGHLIVAPRRHVSTIHALTIVEQKAIWDLVAQVREQLLTGLKPESLAIGFSDGLAPVQTDLHAHVHVVPRRAGDPPEPRDGIQWLAHDTLGWPKG
ncbi:MAG: HIT family protein [Acidobacteriia bacterium]|nr:HIT family protein [Terriglobia bacterium]